MGFNSAFKGLKYCSGSFLELLRKITKMRDSGQSMSAQKFEFDIYGNQEKWVPVTTA